MTRKVPRKPYSHQCLRYDTTQRRAKKPKSQHHDTIQSIPLHCPYVRHIGSIPHSLDTAPHTCNIHVTNQQPPCTAALTAGQNCIYDTITFIDVQNRSYQPEKEVPPFVWPIFPTLARYSNASAQITAPHTKRRKHNRHKVVELQVATRRATAGVGH